MYLLDTNVVSEMRKIEAGRANTNVERWARAVMPASTFLSVITLHELEHGVLLLERRDPHAGSVLRRWLEQDVLETFAGRILAVGGDVAVEAARLHVPDPAPINDAYIAATALVHQLAVVSRNTSDFDHFNGVTTLNPFAEA